VSAESVFEFAPTVGNLLIAKFDEVPEEWESPHGWYLLARKGSIAICHRIATSSEPLELADAHFVYEMKDGQKEPVQVATRRE
jgi:hypothetical protein